MSGQYVIFNEKEDNMKGIHKALLLVAIFAITPMLFADWSGFVGYVYHGHGSPAYPAYVRVWNDGFDETTENIENGWYEQACPGGYYTMRAWKGLLSQTKYNQECSWSTRVDFYIGYENIDGEDE